METPPAPRSQASVNHALENLAATPAGAEGTPPARNDLVLEYEDVLNAKAALSQHKRLAQLQDDLSLARYDATCQMNQALGRLRYVNETIQALTSTFSLQTQEDIERTPERSFDSLRRQLKDDQTELSRCVDTTMQQQDRVKLLEHKCLETQTGFNEAFERFIRSLPGASTAIGSPPVSKTSQSGTKNSPTSIPCEAHDYFEKVGALKLLEQEQRDLDIAHQVALGDRDFVRDQERELSLTDSEFKEQHILKREKLYHTIEDTKDEVAALYLICQELGLDLARLRFRRSSDSPAEPRVFVSASVSTDDNESPAFADGIPLTSSYPNRGSDVEQWLAGVSRSPSMHEAEAEAAGQPESATGAAGLCGATAVDSAQLSEERFMITRDFASFAKKQENAVTANREELRRSGSEPTLNNDYHLHPRKMLVKPWKW